MAEPLKFMYNPAFFERLCPVLSNNIPGFDCKEFIFRVFNNTWPDLELKERIRRISIVLHHFLGGDFPSTSRQLVSIAHQIQNTGVRPQSFQYIFLADYVSVFGLAHLRDSMIALEEITRLVSAEFAIRPFIVRYPEETMKLMYAWSKHPDENIRRLSSEGCRPRLPWGMGLADFKQDPSPVIPILETLKADPSEYVRKSVANHLNDIAKDHPKLIIEILKKWKGQHPLTDWILKHGSRSLLKKGDTEVLTLYGFSPTIEAGIRKLQHNRKVKIGQSLDFKFDIINKENRPANVRLDYAIDYLTSTGKISRKIFKISEKIINPGEPITIHRKQSFKNFTIRKHFKGKHQLSILANGKKIAATEFIVC